MKKYEEAKQDYDKGLKYKDIAEKYGVSINTVKSWKSRYWTQKVATKDKKVATLHPSKSGHPPKQNKNAVTHGLFANWLPDDTQDLIDAIGESSPADIVWQNITIQYAAIIRSQKLMYVTNHDDMSKEISSSGDMVTTYDVQYAWDKQATFLSAQSRAMGTLTNLIKQFESMTDAHDERRLKLEGMKASVRKANAEADIAEVKAKEYLGITDDEEDDGFIEAIDGRMKDVWDDEES
ncbi:phage terminase small subunit [Lacticaseibacillus saniviri]|uniref:Terminase small subunit n=1 Tax=Lacticaseibacillus saniviri JCM 17471 = DSM 24301 TaxID=1293598 RepID=A0A0R2MWA6_9LACO|nr:phage terminase small subunit [Lacticaseibacillus saniviri]KRO16507.1 terminase small subunit [Lacticaseibacillus saniviri JCM 17471 = DSM 24301]